MQNLETDVIIVGAGPSGLFAVFECGFLGYQCVVIDALDEVGGQLAALYPEKPIYDIPGHPHILAKDLVTNLVEQAAPFNPAYLLGHPAETLTEDADGRFTITTREAKISAKAVIIAGGGGMFTPRKPPGLDNLADFEHRSLFYAVKQKENFKNKHVVIAGGGDSAVDWAIELAPQAASLHIVHRRTDFRAAEESVRKLEDMAATGTITIHTPAHLSALNGTEGQLETVNIKDLDGNETTVQADAALCFFGIAPNPGPFEAWNLTLDRKKLQTEPVTQKTNRAGIFAIGDIALYEGKISLILVGFAEAAQAARAIQQHINPEKKYKVQYSTAAKPGM